jgi:hypothetical protein
MRELDCRLAARNYLSLRFKTTLTRMDATSRLSRPPLRSGWSAYSRCEIKRTAVHLRKLRDAHDDL